MMLNLVLIVFAAIILLLAPRALFILIRGPRRRRTIAEVFNGPAPK